MQWLWRNRWVCIPQPPQPSSHTNLPLWGTKHRRAPQLGGWALGQAVPRSLSSFLLVSFSFPLFPQRPGHPSLLRRERQRAVPWLSPAVMEGKVSKGPGGHINREA